MRVLVTGASGFLGRSVVRTASAAGHEVTALVRPTANLGKLQWPENVRVIRGDLRQVGEWSKQLGDIEAVAHLAAVPSGDLPTQFSGTVVATENLLKYLPMNTLHRIVHVSSFSVYDYESLGFHATLTEATAIEPHPETRDAYTLTKIVQEQLVVDACEKASTPFVIIRPGAIVGPGKNWGFGRVMKLGRFDLIFAPGAKFPLTFVDNCAAAIVKSLDAHVRSASVYNIVDDELPSYFRFHRLGRRSGDGEIGPALYVPAFAVYLIGAAVALVNRLAFNGRARLPEFLDRRRQRVRWRGLFYSNRAAKLELGWSPEVSLEAAIPSLIEA
jgi:nucleoside-diphosphate-sugar epimerase